MEYLNWKNKLLQEIEISVLWSYSKNNKIDQVAWSITKYGVSLQVGYSS